MTVPAVLNVQVDPSDIVRLEIWNNDGQLLVEKMPAENLGAIKSAELWDDRGELSLLLDGGSDDVEYQVSVEIWKRDSLFTPHSAFSFIVAGGASESSEARTVLDLREADENLSVQVDTEAEAGPTISEPALALGRGLPFSALTDTDLSMARASAAMPAGYPGAAGLATMSGPVNYEYNANELQDSLRFDFNEGLKKLYRNGFSYAGPALNGDATAGSRRGTRDKETARFWTDLAVGSRFSLNMSAEEQRDVLDQRVDKPSYVDRFTGLSANISLSDWPNITSSVWYKEGVRNTRFVPIGKDAYEGDVQNSGVSLNLRNGWSSHSLTASYSDSYDRLSPDNLAQSVSQSVSSSLFPTSAFSFGATLSINEDSVQNPSYVWAGKYFSESVWATFRPPNTDFRVTLSQYEDAYATLDGSTSYGGLYNSVTLAYDRLSLFEQRFPLAFTVQRGDYFNHVDPAGSTQDTTFRLQFGAN